MKNFWQIIGLLLISMATYGNSSWDNACHFHCPLKEGIYLGVAAGWDAYAVSNDTSSNAIYFGEDAPLGFTSQSHLAVTGMNGGIFLGYGAYFEKYYSTYLGFELFANGSSAAASNNWSGSTDGIVENYQSDIKAKNNMGFGILPGIKLTRTTLLYIKLGYNWSKIDVNESYIINNVMTTSHDDSAYTNGFNYGLGIESAFFDNFSWRLEFTHVQYNGFNTDTHTQIHPNNTEFMLGMNYHFAL